MINTNRDRTLAVEQTLDQGSMLYDPIKGNKRGTTNISDLDTKTSTILNMEVSNRCSDRVLMQLVGISSDESTNNAIYENVSNTIVEFINENDLLQFFANLENKLISNGFTCDRAMLLISHIKSKVLTQFAYKKLGCDSDLLLTGNSVQVDSYLSSFVLNPLEMELTKSNLKRIIFKHCSKDLAADYIARQMTAIDFNGFRNLNRGLTNRENNILSRVVEFTKNRETTFEALLDLLNKVGEKLGLGFTQNLNIDVFNKLKYSIIERSLIAQPIEA